MKLLLDQNLSFKLCDRLFDVFPESSQVRLLGLDRADDRTVWNFAKANGYTLVSFDADFAELSALVGPPPRVIWRRCGDQRTTLIEQLLRRHATAIAEMEFSPVACLEIY